METQEWPCVSYGSTSSRSVGSVSGFLAPSIRTLADQYESTTTRSTATITRIFEPLRPRLQLERGTRGSAGSFVVILQAGWCGRVRPSR